MKDRFRHFGLIALGGSIATMFGLSGGGLWWQLRAFERARGKLEAREREWQALSLSKPSPSEETASAVAAQLSRCERELERLTVESRLLTERSFPPGRAEEAFFEIAGLVERMREQAARSGVRLKDDERFGFADFTKIGPDASRVEDVRRQQRLAETVLEALFEAQPRELIGCSRSRGRGAIEEDNRWGTGEADEKFEIDPNLTLAEPGVFETRAYRITFVGRTATLRALLNRLANCELPIAVRGVEVEVAEEDAPPGQVEVPRVGSTWSRFMVTVEYVQMADRTEASRN